VFVRNQPSLAIASPHPRLGTVSGLSAVVDLHAVTLKPGLRWMRCACLMPYGSCPVVCQQSPRSTDGSRRGGRVYSAAGVGAGLGNGGNCLRGSGGCWGDANLPVELGGSAVGALWP
jgi:hypothetical protein